MGERGSSGSRWVWVGAAIAATASAGFMIWLWASGGLGPPSAAARDIVEECGATIAGSRALTAGVGVEGAALFLQASGYAIEPAPEATAEETKVIGARGDFRCTITFRHGTAAQGIADLIAGRALLAFTLRPMTPADVQAMAAAGAGDMTRERALAEHIIAFDAMAIAVNAANPVRTLSLDDARDVATSTKTNWSEIGGTEDLPITLYGPKDTSMPEDYPNDLIMHRSPVWEQNAARAQIVDTEDELLQRLAADRGGLAYITASKARNAPNVRMLAVGPRGAEAPPSPDTMRQEAYAMARRVFIYARPADMETNTFVQRFIAFFQSAGMYDALDAAGFAALRPDSRLARFASGLARCRFGTPEYAAVMSATRGARKLPDILNFVPNTTRPDDAALAYIATNAAQMRARLQAGDEVILIGHSDFTGDAEPNRVLAQRRAAAARTAFEEQGVFGIEVESAGEMCAMADNESEDGRERNRRVEIWVRPRESERAATQSAR
ncbi:MAG: OmpA family protein [Alphaproteobacteria bacterium]|nr:OmpA family protein [Alphaproteobacteria bacterium]